MAEVVEVVLAALVVVVAVVIFTLSSLCWFLCNIGREKKHQRNNIYIAKQII